MKVPKTVMGSSRSGTTSKAYRTGGAKQKVVMATFFPSSWAFRTLFRYLASSFMSRMPASPWLMIASRASLKWGMRASSESYSFLVPS